MPTMAHPTSVLVDKLRLFIDAAASPRRSSLSDETLEESLTDYEWEVFQDLRKALEAYDAYQAELAKATIVRKVTPETMMGSTPLEKALNAYLTKQFIWSHDIPSDECLSEAREILDIVRESGEGINLFPKKKEGA